MIHVREFSIEKLKLRCSMAVMREDNRKVKIGIIIMSIPDNVMFPGVLLALSIVLLARNVGRSPKCYRIQYTKVTLLKSIQSNIGKCDTQEMQRSE